MTNFKAFTPSF